MTKMKQAQTTLSEPGAASVSLGGGGGLGVGVQRERERGRELGILKVHGELPGAVKHPLQCTQEVAGPKPAFRQLPASSKVARQEPQPQPLRGSRMKMYVF